MVTSLQVGLLRAEKRLGTDLMLVLHGDGSGCVRKFDESLIFQFDKLNDLATWMRSPRVVVYDEEGAPVC